jgi:hypothetical protein
MSDPHGTIALYRKGGIMTVDELISQICEDNFSHIEFMENMNGGDCDCNIHYTLGVIARYAGIEVG